MKMAGYSASVNQGDDLYMYCIANRMLQRIMKRAHLHSLTITLRFLKEHMGNYFRNNTEHNL